MITPEPVHIAKCPFLLNEVPVYILENFLSDQEFSILRDYVISFADLSLTSQNFDRKRMYDEEGKEVTLMGYYRNRPFRKIWHLGHVPGYWQQSRDTIHDFWYSALRRELHPMMLRYTMRLKNEVSLFQGDWLPSRSIINLLENGRTLDVHCDGNFIEVDVEKPAPTVSSTLYIRMAKKGGNLWFADGWINHPIENSVAIFNGIAAFHGISAPQDDDPNFVRLAITTRWVRAQDLLFPSDAPMLYPPDPNDMGV